MSEQIPFQKIVVPLDGSRRAEQAIPHAAQIARGGGELMLVHVFRPAGSEFLSDAAIASQTAHIDEARKRAEQYVKGLRSRVSSQHIRVSAHVIEGSDAAQLICTFVNAEEADVVVMPAASQNRLVRMLLGDLTASVSGCTNACLLLVRGDPEVGRDDGSQAGSAAESEPVHPESDVLLRQLISLRDAGILSEGEFEAKKAAVQKRQHAGQG